MVTGSALLAPDGILIGTQLADDLGLKTGEKLRIRTGSSSTQAADKKGDERKAFMKTCLSNKPATQQDKMKTCNADAKAKTLKGDERKAFMSECLKK
eukprot:gene20498-20413_t